MQDRNKFEKNRGPLKEHEHKIKISMGNSTERGDKKSTKTGKNDKIKKKMREHVWTNREKQH